MIVLCLSTGSVLATLSDQCLLRRTGPIGLITKQELDVNLLAYNPGNKLLGHLHFCVQKPKVSTTSLTF